MDCKQISELFKEKGLTLGAVESFTGGRYAAEITALPGASKFFKGSLVTYATEEKMRILSINKSLIERVGVVSQEVGGEMSGHGKFLLNTDFCISFTGNAGPEAMEGKPVGECYVGISSADLTRVYKLELQGSRDEIIEQAISIGNDLLASFINL